MRENHLDNLDDLKQFLVHFTVIDEARHRTPDGTYFYDISLPFRDLNREIIPPGINNKNPEGGVGIRCDGDFWCVAYLPYQFHHLSCDKIAKCLWPDVAGLSFLPDSGDNWWTAVENENLEVPGEPHEVWIRNVYTDSCSDEHIRFKTYATLESAQKEAAHHNTRNNSTWYVMSWQDGVRTMAKQ